MSDPLEPGLVDLYVQGVARRAGIAHPDFLHRESDAVVVKAVSGVTAEAFLLVIDGGRLDDALDDAALTAQIGRDAVVTDWCSGQHPHLIAVPERRLFSVRVDDAVTGPDCLARFALHRKSFLASKSGHGYQLRFRRPRRNFRNAHQKFGRADVATQ